MRLLLAPLRLMVHVTTLLVLIATGGIVLTADLVDYLADGCREACRVACGIVMEVLCE